MYNKAKGRKYEKKGEKVRREALTAIYGYKHKHTWRTNRRPSPSSFIKWNMYIFYQQHAMNIILKRTKKIRGKIAEIIIKETEEK